MTLYRQFQYTLGKSNKKWVVYAPRPTPANFDKSGSWAVTFRWGRVGNELQGLTKYFSTEWDAKCFVNGKVSEKLGKGYVEIGPAPKQEAYIISPTAAEMQATPVVIFGAPPANLDVAFDKAKTYVAANAPKCAHNSLTRQHNGWKCISCLETVEFEKKTARPVTQLEVVRYFNLEDLQDERRRGKK